MVLFSIVCHKLGVDAYLHVKKFRDIAFPNVGFATQLGIDKIENENENQNENEIIIFKENMSYLCLERKL